MLVIRFAGFLQPAWARTALVFADTTSAVADRLQPAITRATVISHEATRLIAAFLTPASLTAASMALWRLGADLGWTGAFAISNGLFSHWQVWGIMALGLKMTGSLIYRGAEGNAEAEPEDAEHGD
ncbi:MAG: hypothetical protein M3Y27_23645 [Acidobacteriota bacterium]|nr:hypothetical protein [Acidobacteriota bacterium]